MNRLYTFSESLAVAPELIIKDRWPSALRLLFRRVFIVSAVVLITTGASATPNVLVNGDFEGTSGCFAPTSYANNFPWCILPWVIGTGQQANVVTVKANGSYAYLAGPQHDASGVGGSGQRHYLDIKNGHNDIYQPFTLPCEGKVLFGGYFSSRCDDNGTAHAGTGNIQIVQGTGTGGTQIATTNTVTLPAGGNAHTDPWKLASGSVNVPAGTYSFVVKMSDDVNFDEAYVKYEIDCNVTPSPTTTSTPTVTPASTLSPTPTATPISPTPTPTPTPAGCAEVTGEARCLPNGGYSYTFTVTNSSGSDMSQILLTPAQGSTFTLTPQLTNLPTPLQSGQSTTVTTNIGSAKPGDEVCFFVSLMSEKTQCCIVQVCPTLPRCGVIETATPPPPARQQRPPPPSRRGRRHP